MIPVVTRTVTVRARAEHDLPFACARCGFSGTARVAAEGVGAATMAYVRPDESAARARAAADAERNARASLVGCPCPRCGGPSVETQAALEAHARKVASRKKVRLAVLAIGALLTLGCMLGCVGSYLVSAQGRAHPESAIVFVCFWTAVGPFATLAIWALAGPGSGPRVLAAPPPNVRFSG